MTDPAKEQNGDADSAAHGAKHRDPLLKIVREKDPKKPSEELDLELGEFEGDRRFGREDIADK